ncbi:hypothetical protein [Brachybacterium sacelli]|uniref:hypothetical protein n=1 Tax=Brachybacterium sacelli TaxID=173364 RepID=UPI00361604A3
MSARPGAVRSRPQRPIIPESASRRTRLLEERRDLPRPAETTPAPAAELRIAEAPKRRQ